MLFELRLDSRKSVNVFLMRDLWNFSFFGRGEVSPPHSEHCCFVSGSQAKHQVLSPVIILLEICLSASAIAITSWQDVPRTSLCSSVKYCGKKTYTQIFLSKSSFKIRKTTVFVMFRESAIVIVRFEDHFDQISNSSNVYLSSNQFRTAISLALFYQLPSVSKSRIPPKIN
jgi:hypothetical protein